MTTASHNAVMQPVNAYLAHLSAIGHPSTTVTTYRYALQIAARELPGGLLSLAEEIETWLGTRRSPSTRIVYRAALRGFYTWAVKRQWISANPAAELDPVKRRRGVPRPCTLEQLAQILARAGEPVRLWALLAAYAGARCIEISRLDRGDVTEQITRLHGKGDRERLVPTHPQLWVAVAPLPGGLLAGGLGARQISSRGNARFDRIGLADVTMHRIRHLAGTLWQAATGDIRVTQELLGHASVATTQVYTAVSDRAMRAAVLAMPAITPAAATAADADPAGSSAPGPPQ